MILRQGTTAAVAAGGRRRLSGSSCLFLGERGLALGRRRVQHALQVGHVVVREGLHGGAALLDALYDRGVVEGIAEDEDAPSLPADP